MGGYKDVSARNCAAKFQSLVITSCNVEKRMACGDFISNINYWKLNAVTHQDAYTHYPE